MHMTVEDLNLRCLKPGDHITILVHPGSACGSANFNLGRQQAQSARSALIAEIQACRGHLLVLTGMLDDELPDYPAFDQAIAQALADNQSTVRGRIMAHDPDQVVVAQQLAKRLGHQLNDVHFTITGAWLDDYMPGVRGGCVGSVYEALKAAGACHLTISDNAVAAES